MASMIGSPHRLIVRPLRLRIVRTGIDRGAGWGFRSGPSFFVVVVTPVCIRYRELERSRL